MTIHRKGLVVEMIGGSCHSVVLLVLESVFVEGHDEGEEQVVLM